MFFSKKAFSERFNELVRAHEMPVQLLTDILKFKSRSSVVDFAAGRTVPSLESLALIAETFCVSADWLIGASPDPHPAPVIEFLENNLFEETATKHPNISDHPDLVYFYAALTSGTVAFDDYLDNSRRSIRFSLPVRANVVFFLNLTKYFSITTYLSGIDPKRVTCKEALERLRNGTKTQKQAAGVYSLAYTSLLAIFKDGDEQAHKVPVLALASDL